MQMLQISTMELKYFYDGTPIDWRFKAIDVYVLVIGKFQAPSPDRFGTSNVDWHLVRWEQASIGIPYQLNGNRFKTYEVEMI